LNHPRASTGRASTFLPADSLAFALTSAAQAVATVIGAKGRNLDVALAALQVPAAARPAIQDLAYGALRRFGRGDFFLNALVDKPLKEPAVRALLLAAFYRLELRPDDAHTTVDQAVAAAAGQAGGRFKGLVNAVLRNFLRRRDELIAAVDSNEAARWQHPLWWIDALRAAYPDRWQSVLEAGNGHPPMALRVNAMTGGNATEYLAQVQAAGVGARAASDLGILLDKPVGVDKLPGFFDGHASVQDLGAQRAATLLDAQPGERVLDACAAPGGKTAHMLERSGNRLDLLALDADAKRAKRIQENLDRLHLTAQVKAADCRKVSEWWDGKPFDHILADVPCSASGVVRRHPDAKWLRRPEDVAGFAATQAEILEALWPTLAPNGTMLYCTCSVFPAENSQQVARFLARHGDAERLQLEQQPELQLLPTAEHDGFYYALLRKRAA
jgi:16S rRNA (cytosine967-C5)-methyltransferase